MPVGHDRACGDQCPQAPRLGFTGPERGTRHEFLLFRERRQTVPSNPEFSVPQVKLLLRQVEAILGRKISAEEWAEL
jgi:hypothetical protein